MAELLKLREADDPRDVIHRAVHRLVEGALVAVPSETSEMLVANSLCPEAVTRLQTWACVRQGLDPERAGGQLLLGVKGADEARDYVLDASAMVDRLMRRLWPGSVILVLPVELNRGLHSVLPPRTQRTLLRNVHEDKAEIWFRVPKQREVLSVMSLLPAPLVFWEDRQATSGERLSQSWAKDGDLILEDTPHQDLKYPTVIQVKDNSWTLREPGVVTETQLNRMTGQVILFVCTGNTCRSPLAEGLFRKLLADRLGCSPDDLPDRGYTILSAGLAAASGAPAAMESIEVARNYGANLESHSSQPLTDELLAKADRVYTMTQSHRDSILFARPDAADRVYLLSQEETDICDPIGGGASEYESCGREIALHLEKLLDDLEPASKS
ncbi:MAG: Sua5/YciO/YrdC/YwlC family protein [Planctomycetaceae bacterium]|nr:Sua5/YciO/YrdC/YwlC family protein [Planctomycetaceae bacterium]